MTMFEYRVLPAPSKGLKAKGVKTTEARFAHALMQIMNEMGREGWEYQRTDTLPCEERVGFTGRTTKFQNMLVFRRALAAAEATRPVPPARVEAEAPPQPAARRIFAALSSRPQEGPAPALRAVPDATAEVPRIGSARGKGLPHPSAGGNDPGVAAE